MLVVIFLLLAISLWYWWWTAKTEKGRAFLAEMREKQRLEKEQRQAQRQLSHTQVNPIPPSVPSQPTYFQSPDYQQTRANFNDVSNDTTVYPMTHHMKYMNRDGGYSERDIGIVRSYRKSKRWYIDAYCYKRHEVRTFAVENILELEDLMAGNIYKQPNLIRESIKEFEE